MPEIIDNLQSPSWWFSVVIVGILVSIIAAYFQRSLEGQLSKLSSFWRKLADRETAAAAATLKRLQADTQERYFYGMNILRFHILALQFTAIATFLAVVVDIYFPILMEMDISVRGAERPFLIAGPILVTAIMFFSATALLVGFQFYLSARRQNRLLLRARYPEQFDERTKP
jgi:hypothetical protein